MILFLDELIWAWYYCPKLDRAIRSLFSDIDLKLRLMRWEMRAKEVED